jgi:alkanesulfonate monooxygenase SsuD/methylene tetrahydromethanopterin reductase-like flavin-dependent oxidoreductase (luciferase family)
VVWDFDAWVLLVAAAMQTERINLGTMLTPRIDADHR